MAFQRPTLPELVDRIQSDFISRLTLVGAVLRRAMVYVLSRVLAGAAHLLHGHLEYLGKQLFPDLSDRPFLIRQASAFGMTPNAPGFAKATVGLTGTNGSVVPVDTVLVRADGANYTVDADVTISGGVATAAVTAELAGADSTLTAGVVLSFQSPIAGVNATGTVASSTVDGSDVEDTEAFRSRFLDRLRSPPHGGNDADYVAWAKEVSGVTRAWCYPQELGPGTVTVRFMRDNDAGGAIPDTGEVAAVQSYIDALRPVTATLTVVAPVANPVAYTVSITPDTADTRAAVTAELDDMHLRLAQPGGTLRLSSIETAIGTAAGITNFVLTLPAADVTNSTGYIPTRGAVTFV